MSENELPDEEREEAAMRMGSTEAPLCLHLFGRFEAQVCGVPLPPLRTRKGEWLLTLLALRAGGAIERRWLAGILWPETPDAQSLRNLRTSLADLRQALGPEADRLRSPTAHTLCLDLSGAAVDVIAFDRAIRQGDARALEQAVALYRGPLLEGWTAEWVFQERHARQEAYLTALETLAAQALASGDAAVAERHLRRAVAADPLRETAQRSLMQALAASGNYAAAIQTYRELRLLLHREINVEPDAETEALFQRLRAEARGKAAPGSPPPAYGSWLTADGPDSRRPHREPCIHPLRGYPSHEPSFPTGTVTLLFTDIEGSSRLWEEHPEAMRAALARHDALLRQVIETHAGHVFKTMGDQFCAAFAAAAGAAAAAVEAQRALQTEEWREVGSLRVRMALSTGAVELRGGDYFGPALNRVARLLAAGHGGQLLLSQTTAGLVGEALPPEMSLRDLGAHRLKDLSQPEHVFQLLVQDLHAEFPPLRSLETFAHNLPAQLTSFIGREQAMAEVKQLLAATRLLTLTGSGGCGKTRLSLQVAADLLEPYADGVWLVELAALGDPALVPQTVAAALGVREEPGRSLTATLTDYLRPKALLLILDNCEHLLAACAQLADALLRSCPSLRLLASSREALGIGGEQTYRVPSLSLPDARHLPPLERLRDFEAVQLFADRARLSQASFAVTEANAAAVAQVCQRLDGIPLAIELAAARVRALPVEQIQERLDDMFRLLTGGSRAALPRQQTLRALIDWSYDLLSPPEQTLLRHLSVFSGGWTLEAAEAVGAGDDVEAWEVLDLLTSLVGKSLVLYDEQASEGRYRLLETVRQYARDRLLDSGEVEDVRDRHLVFFLEWVEQRQSLERLETEHDNLRAALRWSRTQGKGEVGLRLGGALGGFWDLRGYLEEGREHLTGLLALPGAEARTAPRARALQGAGWLASYQGDYAAGRALLEESLAISREMGLQHGVAASLGRLGSIAHDQGDLGAAQGLLEESLAIFRELGKEDSIAWTLHHRGNVALSQRDNGAARGLSEESLAIFRELGNKEGIAWSLNSLGRVARAQGDWGAARALFEESLAIFRELGSKEGIGGSLIGLGRVAGEQREYGAARALFEESLAIFRERGQKGRIAQNLEGLAAVAVAQAQPERAARLFGAAEGLREAMGAPLPPAARAEHDRSAAAVRTALGEAAFTAAWAAGRAMSLEQAVADALEDTGA